MKRKYEEMNLQKLSEIDPKFMALEKEREEITKVRIIEHIVMGPFEIGTWYFSPFPDEYGNCKKLFVCECCLKYMKLEETFVRHCVRGEPGELSLFFVVVLQFLLPNQRS